MRGEVKGEQTPVGIGLVLVNITTMIYAAGGEDRAPQWLG